MLLLVCVRAWAHALQYTHGGWRSGGNCRCCVSPYTLPVLGLELSSSDLLAGAFTGRVMSGPKFVYFIFY